MSKSDCSKLHIAMFPWVAYGHFIPFISQISWLKEAIKYPSFCLKEFNQSLKTRTNSPTSFNSFLSSFLKSMTYSRDQVESIFKVLKPDIVFYDFWFWIPELARQIGIHPIFYVVVSSMSMALNTKKLTKEMTAEKVMELPPGYPSSTVKLKAEEAAAMTCREIEGPFLDYVGKGLGSLFFLSGPCLPETRTQQLDDKWVNWLSQFEPGSVVFCSFGSQSVLQKDFQELVLGFELSGLPFLVALKPPQGCSTVKEALPAGFQERVKGRGLVSGGWVPQEQLLHHPNIGDPTQGWSTPQPEIRYSRVALEMLKVAGLS
ncbi:hypothetical protein F3Y22_tig00110472pilonHSYRG00232 [Hibiscus syriacus]|uniref:Uncharacterized protein n=1 Tax=Hibiscus syriacus TaxID=106335 RepID=A0A6A3AI26_HIBSY|nr:hypothetical protein F3Y22_tig00110472pilonHSYRG00232 [Hibiscus syriacus]